MSIQSITTKVISTLGNKESLIPIIVKDGVDSTALTVKSFKEGGAVEGTDRFIDEFGTQAIWVGGIPFYKKLIDWTAYKMASSMDAYAVAITFAFSKCVASCSAFKLLVLGGVMHTNSAIYGKMGRNIAS